MRLDEVRREMQKVEVQIQGGPKPGAPDQISIFYDIVKHLDPNGLIVEIGTYKGGSALMFSLMNPQVRILTIDAVEEATDYWDPLTYPPGHNIREGRLLPSGILPENLCRGKIFQVIGFSKDIAQTFNWRIDFLFIDGHWKYEPTKIDFESWAPFVKPGGWIIGHHYCGEAYEHEAKRAIDEWIAEQSEFYWVGEMELMAVIRRR